MRHPGRVRVAIVAESFLPHMNGVTRSVMEIAAHLQRHGHEALIIAPAAMGMPDVLHGAPVVGVASVPLPGYADVRVAASGAAAIGRILDRFAPDMIHLASPFALGSRAVAAARRRGIPVVAAYQTDVIAYAARYGVGVTTAAAERHVTRLHRRSTLTLVPSQSSEDQLTALGIDRLRRWGRGVDTARFSPAQRSDAWRERVAPGRVVVGYVGRLAAEKQVHDLAVLSDLPDARVVIVGDGPERAALQRRLPDAAFLGHLDGAELTEAVASFDVFVHPGESETFGQTLQEAHASGVPVVAVGRGGPRDLVRSSVDGWLYRPGDLDDLRARVADLVGDARKRRAFGAAGVDAVRGRTWEALCDQLLAHFREAIELAAVDRATRVRRAVRAEPAPASAPARWGRVVALGDSLTEGLCDPGPDGALRGWADRLALLLAGSGTLSYANLAVRSRRVRDVAGPQLAHARRLRPELVTILIGSNDLVKLRPDIPALAARVEQSVLRLRADGAEVLLVTPFLPYRPESRPFARSFAAFATALAGVAARTGALLLDTDLVPELGRREYWADDLVHLAPAGHRLLAYRAASLLGVAHADELAGLDETFHATPHQLPRREWWRRHALPWMWRRLRGRSAGDGLGPKHDEYVLVGARGSGSRRRQGA